MARLIACMLALGLVSASSARAEAFCEVGVDAQKPSERADDRRRGERRIKWWLDEKSRQELGITDQQSGEIEQIFQSTLPLLRRARKQLDELESTLSKMIKDGTAPVEVITEHVERVESARAEMNKRRTVMLYRIDRVLSADQRAKLKAWHERERSHRSGRGPGRH